MGEWESAVSHYNQAIDIARDVSDKQGETRHAWNLGILLQDSDPQQAIDLMMICVEFERAIGHPDTEKDMAKVEGIKRKHNL